MILLLCLVLAQVPSPPPSPPPEPSYLVERIVRMGAETRRVALFRDGTGVVHLVPASGDEVLKVGPVGELIQGQVEQVVREVYPAIAEFASMGREKDGAQVELRLAPSGLSPLIVRIPFTASPSVSTARLVATLDELEARILANKPPAEDLRYWEPQAGEVVELDDGSQVTVVDVFNTAGGGQTVQVRQGSSPLSAFLDLVDLRRRAVRRVPGESR